jgi:hypothetical protein
MVRAVADCMDRPGSNKTRTVQLVAKLVPVIDQGGGARDVEIQFEVIGKTPAWRTASRPTANSFSTTSRRTTPGK